MTMIARRAEKNWGEKSSMGSRFCAQVLAFQARDVGYVPETSAM